MVTTIESIGLSIGISGLLIAIYSLIGQRKLETRIKKKEELKALSVKLKHLIKNMEYIINNIKDPLSDSDLFYQLSNLSQGIISKAFFVKENIIDIPIIIRIFSRKKTEASKGTEEKDHFIVIEKKEEIIKHRFSQTV